MNVVFKVGTCLGILGNVMAPEQPEERDVMVSIPVLSPPTGCFQPKLEKITNCSPVKASSKHEKNAHKTLI